MEFLMGVLALICVWVLMLIFLETREGIPYGYIMFFAIGILILAMLKCLTWEKMNEVPFTRNNICTSFIFGCCKL